MPIVRQRLREARENAGLSQEEVAQKLILKQGSYSDIERGRTVPSIDHLLNLSTILSKPVTWFLGIENGNDLSPDEKDLVDCYRSLTHTNKEIVFNFAQDLRRREEAKFS